MTEAMQFNFLTEINGTCPQVKCKACLPGYGYVKDAGGCPTCKCARKLKYSSLCNSMNDCVVTNLFLQILGQ